MISVKDVDEHARKMRQSMNVFVEIMQQDPSKEKVFGLLRAALNSILKAIDKYQDDIDHKDTAIILLSNVIVASMLAVIENNPMYDSRALSMQLDSAIDKVIEDYKKQMLNPEMRRGR